MAQTWYYRISHSVGEALDIYRPAYHFTPPAGWMNDPNGLVYQDGEWHLFYQHTPPGGEGQHWGHAASRDLTRWQHLPIALPPDELGNIWSGSAVVDSRNTSGFFDDDQGLVAIFTHQNSRDGQRQSLAFSRDRGRTWEKYAGNPVLTGEVSGFRDPKVFWHGPSRRWVMVLATGDCASFYTSPNLKEWRFASRFVNTSLPDCIWECPDLIELPVDGDRTDTRWVLIGSFVEPERPPDRLKTCVIHTFIGHFDGKTFHSDDAGQPLNYGTDDYAAVSWSNASDGRHIIIGWMNHWGYARATPTSGWQGALTVPRELEMRTIDDEIRLLQHPVAELHQLRRDSRSWHDEKIDGEQILCQQTGAAFELELVMEPGTANECGLHLLAGNEQRTTLGYYTGSNTLFLDRSRSGKVDFHPYFASRQEAPLTCRYGKLHLRILVDSCSVEIFAGEGEVLMSNLIFPDMESQSLIAYAHGGAAMMSSLTMHTLHLA